MIPDAEWENIKPLGKPAGAGLLCGPCITERLEYLRGHQYSAYRLVPL